MPRQWQTLTGPKERFTIEFPSKPTYGKDVVPTEGASIESHIYEATYKNNSYYMIIYEAVFDDPSAVMPKSGDSYEPGIAYSLVSQEL